MDVAVASSLEDAVAGLHAAVDALAAAPLTGCTDDELVAAWRQIEMVRRRFEPIDHRLIAEMDQRGLDFRAGCKNMVGFARSVLRVSAGEAAARVRAAAALGPRRSLLGEVLEPIYPGVAAAQADGAISARHAQVIVSTIEALPVEVAAGLDRTVEAILVAAARDTDPACLAQHARDLAYRLDQDGQYDEAAYRDRTRALSVCRRVDGSARLDGELTAECAEYLETVLDCLGAPKPEADGVKDPRTAAQRRHDALLETLKIGMRAQELPAAGGVTATIILAMGPEAWVTGQGSATTGHGYTIPAELAKRWARDQADHDEARIIAVLMSITKSIEGYSSVQRLFTEPQRLAMMARDRGCAFHDCDAPPGHCDAHHMTDYQDTGRTCVDDGALLCGTHHDTFVQQGWTGTMIDGVPHWTAPTWLDPNQIRRRNTRHDRDTDTNRTDTNAPDDPAPD